MSPGLDTLTRQCEMHAGGSGDVYYVQMFPGQHLGDIAVPGGHTITNGKLLCQKRLAVAHRRELRTFQVLHYFSVSIGDLSAADDSYA